MIITSNYTLPSGTIHLKLPRVRIQRRACLCPSGGAARDGALTPVVPVGGASAAPAGL